MGDEVAQRLSGRSQAIIALDAVLEWSGLKFEMAVAVFEMTDRTLKAAKTPS